MTMNRTLFHQLWTKAVGTPGYDKEQWCELETHIKELAHDSHNLKLANARHEHDILRLREAHHTLLSASGDDLCWFDPNTIPVPPRAEFLESCARFYAQISEENGESIGCKTIRQLEEQNMRLQQEIEQLKGA